MSVLPKRVHNKARSRIYHSENENKSVAKEKFAEAEKNELLCKPGSRNDSQVKGSWKVSAPKIVPFSSKGYFLTPKIRTALYCFTKRRCVILIPQKWSLIEF